MNRSKRLFVLVGLLLLSAAGIASAQGDGEIPLTLGQPVIAQVEAGATVRYSYGVAQPSIVTFQAMSDSARPVLSVLLGDVAMAFQPNDAAEATVTLETFLDAGDYTVEASTRDLAAGTIILLAQSETPVAVMPLLAGQSLDGAVRADSALALYSLSALGEPAYLFVDGGLPGQGVDARLVEAASGSAVAVFDSLLTGARLTIPVGDQKYRLEIAHGGVESIEPFRICFVAASMGSCSPGIAAPLPTPTVAQVDAACRVTPNSANGANLRQTASVNAPVVVAIPANDSALVSRVSPDGAFYNAVYGNWSGWVAAVAVTLSGECGALPVSVPPSLPPTITPIPPTPAPTMPPAPPAPTQALGPCHVVFSADELVYVQPEVNAAYIQDEISAGGELIPVGRWQDNPSWWKTNYAGAWWLNAPGTAGQVMGDCSGLPLVAWP